jgi:zinc transport system permease protein
VALVSPEIAMTSGINVSRLNLLYLLTFALTVALGLRYLGVLLMGSLIIIPAATAKRLARDLSGMLVISVIVAVASTLLGTYAAVLLHRETGPLIITVAGGLFVLSLLA